jgi:hypothetical protein
MDTMLTIIRPLLGRLPDRQQRPRHHERQLHSSHEWTQPQSWRKHAFARRKFYSFHQLADPLLANTIQVNNYWYANSGHAFEVGTGASIVAEGNVFQNVANPIDAGTSGGQIFTASNGGSACSSGLGRACQINAFGSSGSFNSIGSTNFIANFKGKNIASAAVASGVVASVTKTAGFGKI